MSKVKLKTHTINYYTCTYVCIHTVNIYEYKEDKNRFISLRVMREASDYFKSY